jgi:hypothetical protein
MSNKSEYGDYKLMLNTLLEQRIQMVKIWFERWNSRKEDWNNARNKIKETIFAIADKVGIKQEHQDKMNSELSQQGMFIIISTFNY